MESDERPAKIRKISHERDAAAVSAGDQEDVPMQQAPPPDAGTAQTNEPASAPPQADDAPSAIKSQASEGPSAGTTTTGAPTTPAPTSANADASTTTAEASTAPTTQTTEAPLSKNAQKKLRRQQEWDAKKADRKIWRKEKNQAKKERKREQRKQEDETNPEAWKERQRNYVRPTMLPVTFVIDCDFDDKMRDNERISLAGQITRAYSDNRNSSFRAHMAICSFNGKLRERFDGVLNKNYTHWKGVKFLDEDFVVAGEKAKEWMAEERRGGKLAGVFSKYLPAQPDTTSESQAAPPAEPQTTGAEVLTTSAPKSEATELSEPQPTGSSEPKPTAAAPQPQRTPPSLDPTALSALRSQGETIYLSADSPHTLTELRPYSTYIIGGLVDKNREKGICQSRAEAAGIKTARLPIGDYLAMASRKVLATNHVNEIMLRWLECGDWGEAFMRVIPKRKGGMLRGEKGEDGEDEGEEDGEEAEEQEAQEENEEEAEDATAAAQETPAAQS